MVVDSETYSFLRELPKAELHVHVEGTLEPELQFKLAERNQVQIDHAESIEHLKSLYHFSDLQSFLDIYYMGVACLQTELDFYELTMAYMERVHADGCRHVEMFFDPQSHTTRGVTFETVLNGITRALDEARDRLGMSSYLIMCFLRHLSEKEAFEVLEQAMPYLDKIKGVGLDSTELGNGGDKFARVFTRAKELGLERVAHAGEEGPPENIWSCLNNLHVSRIDHGVRCEEDPTLMQTLAQRKIPLTMCPLSNVKLKVVAHLSEHNLKRLFDAGVRTTINSDDPAYFGGYLLDNYAACLESLKLSRKDVATMAKYSFEASFLPNEQVQKHLEEIDRICEKFSV